MMLRHRNDEVGLPCRKTIGSPAPVSTYAISVPSTAARFRGCGSFGEIATSLMEKTSNIEEYGGYRAHASCRRSFVIVSGRGAESKRETSAHLHQGAEGHGGTQAKILGMGLRGPGSHARAAEAYGGADGEALRFAGVEADSATNRGRTEFTRAPRAAARLAQGHLLHEHSRARGAQLWQGVARHHPRVSPLLSESDRRGGVSAR